MPSPLVQYETDGPLAWITLDRPGKLNAINAAMVAGLNAALDRAESDEAVRVILLRGAGRAFSAGFDLQGGGDGSPEAIRHELTADFDVIMRFWHSPKPTIAAVHGYCLGSAMEMAVACDITLAAGDCRFGAPEVKFGSGIVALLLPWLCGPKKAKQWLLTGDDRVSAEQALASGLINEVVNPDRLLDAAREMALQIARNDRLAVTMTKRAINRSMEVGGMHQALAEALEADIVVESTESAESLEFNRILRSEGTRAAIAWRERKYEGKP